jgi:hypothetical protein
VNVFDDGAEAGAGDALPGVRDGVEGEEVGAAAAFVACVVGLTAGEGAGADGA